MPEVAKEGLSRIAFVYGDAAAAAHLRDALAGQVEIAYATTATEFEAQRAIAAGVTAALVNVDGDDWLESLEAALANADLRAVFNDPDISAHLEGWERARWLRHLVAKLRGGGDVDPPRPAPADADRAQSLAAVGTAATADAPAVSERPLSPEEIDSLTADFAATPACSAEPATDSLDVDTEALSALIDARLAEAEERGATDGATEQPRRAATASAAIDAVAQPAPSRQPVDAATMKAEDPDLPALGDWELLDVGQAAAPARPAAPLPPALPDSLANLTLVPLETVAPVIRNNGPVELWMDDAKIKTSTQSRPEAGGGKA